MKIFFIGTVDFSYSMLEELIKNKAEIVGVATKDQSSFNADFKDLQPLCIKHKIDCFIVKDINSEDIITKIKSKNPDVIYCFGWSSLIKKPLLKLAPLGVVGYHPALLPQNRGRHPIIWALSLGLDYTGSTFFKMDEGADSGDILSQEKIKISKIDDAQTLYQKLIKSAKKQVIKITKDLEKDSFKLIKQNHKEANYWRKRNKKDGEIDFRMNAKNIYNLVRALTKPYVGSHLVYKNQEIKIWKSRIVKNNQKNIEAGKIIFVKDKKITVKCGKDAIILLEHEFMDMPKVGDYLI
jgi:methionyl-tRNA formyltransferase